MRCSLLRRPSLRRSSINGWLPRADSAFRHLKPAPVPHAVLSLPCLSEGNLSPKQLSRSAERCGYRFPPLTLASADTDLNTDYKISHRDNSTILHMLAMIALS